MEVCGDISKYGEEVYIHLHPTPKDMAETCDEVMEKCYREQVALCLQASFPARDGNGLERS